MDHHRPDRPGCLCGLVGSRAVLSQRIFFTESITHAAFPGAVIGVVGAALVSSSHEALSLGLFIGAGLASLVLALLMHGVSALKGISSQAAAGITLTVGFASGYFLNKWFAPLPLRIDGFLTGSLLACTRIDVHPGRGQLSRPPSSLLSLGECGR